MAAFLDSLESTLPPSMKSKLNDVEGNVESDDGDAGSDIEQNTGLSVPTVDPSNAVSDVVGSLEDLLDGNMTTEDGTVIPKEVMMNTACIIFGDFAATFVACAFITNIFTFGKEFLLYDDGEIEKTNLIVTGVEAGLYLLTGCFTDWFGGYSEAIKIYGRICFIGACILPLLTFNWSVIGPTYGISVPIRRIFFYTARIVAGLGVCGIQATSPPFAARQIEKYGTNSVQSCFHYIYIAIQCAPLLALTGLSFIQLTVSFFCGYLATVGFIVLKMIFFKYVNSGFRQSTPDKGKAAGSIVTSATDEIKSILSSCRTYCHCSCCSNLTSSKLPSDEESMQLLCEISPIKSLTSSDDTTLLKTTSKQLKEGEQRRNSSLPNKTYPSIPVSTATGNGSAPQPTKATATSSTSPVPSRIAKNSSPSTSTYGSIDLSSSNESLYESVRHCLWVGYAMLLLSCQVPYSMMRHQISTTYVSQAMRMKPSILGTSISPSLLQECLPLVGIVITPLVNVYIYPFIHTRFKTLTLANRIALGIVLATLSVLCAAIAETARKLFIDRGDSFVQEINNQTIVASDLTLDALIPQYVLMGAADVFVFITSLEFAFRQSPCTMQAIATGIFLCYEAVGRIMAVLLLSLINRITAGDPWVPNDINNGHLNFYFLVLTAISLTNLITYLLMEKGYEEVDQYLCPDEETYGGGDSTSRSATPATQPAGTPTSKGLPKTPAK
nr:uncharacterized protein LOC129276397 [Lytechinus pictus]